ncbi:hypothetical protein QJS04_geneDACA021920 [Acorus gramineus]|uniref:Uncharacterized protein n=1 Tax=Acorus gramineus TaxID=55184 RepID=A0AAV9A5C7_ACOGR|nr:hypothetical protein QJS04_geneDACA021920 [Acorus gramineus]
MSSTRHQIPPQAAPRPDPIFVTVAILAQSSSLSPSPKTSIDLDVKLRDAFHRYIEERGLNDSLFQFLQAWLYVKDHRRLMNWYAWGEAL